MKRKLVKHGDITLMVSLPAQWVKQHSLKQGDDIELISKDNTLVLSGKGTASLKTTQIQVTKENLPNLRTAIASAYKAGYDEIALLYTVQPSLDQLNTIVSSFTGLEIVSQTAEQCIIKSFLSKETDETEQLIIKMFQITKLVAETLVTNWQNTDLENIQTLVKINNMKLRDHCLRMIHLNNHGGDKSYDYYDLVTVLEKITAQYYLLAEDIVKKKIKKTMCVENQIHFIQELYEAFLKKDLKKTYAMRVELKQYESKCLAQISKENVVVLMHHYYLLNLYKHISSRLISINS
ncbi:MAG: AbrB/MazE/SpoVT family DNA-binding domain-containing protein [Candidatus Woesearchaeota archaeon]